MVLFHAAYLNVDELLEHVDGGGNLMVAADSGVAELGEELGVQFHPESSRVIDHHGNLGEPLSVLSDQYNRNFGDLNVVLGSCRGVVAFRGVAHVFLDDAGPPMNLPLIVGSRTSYSGRVDGVHAPPLAMGTQSMLLSALQARNGARVVISGSAETWGRSLSRTTSLP